MRNKLPLYLLLMYIRQQSGEIIPLVGPQVQQPIPSTINVENTQPWWIELMKAIMSPYIMVILSMYIMYRRFIQ